MKTPRSASARLSRGRRQGGARAGVLTALSRSVLNRRRTKWPRAAWFAAAVILIGCWFSAGAPLSAAPFLPVQDEAVPVQDGAAQGESVEEPAASASEDEAENVEPAESGDEDESAEAETDGEEHDDADHDHDGGASTGESAGEKHAGGPDHGSIVAPLLAAIVLILFGAKISGDLFERCGIPSVVGELALGIVLGNLVLIADLVFGVEWHFLDFMQPPDPDKFGSVSASNVGAELSLLAEIGVILLLFEVGLECTVREMLRVGWTSLFVAIAGVVAPILLGYVISRAFFFDDWQEPAFIGATLCATSVGITARVLRDINQHKSKESSVILGAAVIDDVLGLIVLAVVQGAIAASLVRDQAMSSPAGAMEADAGDPFWWDVGSIVGLAALFLGGALLLGAMQFPRFLFLMAGKLRGRGLLVVTALLMCFGFSYLADSIGLATIVGAFAAGLILEQAQYQELGEREEVHELEDAIRPITALFVPIFFVVMGMRVDVAEFGGSRFWIMALTFTGLAVLGKMICSFACLEKGVNKIAVGIGMVPRGEVGLIFAAVGSTLRIWDPEVRDSKTGEIVGGEIPVVDDTTFSAIVFMVIVTTVITPPLLKWSLDARDPEDEDPPPDENPADEDPPENEPSSTA
ncbi:MAG: cation:proton antiporter [Planctomycetota bacterium]